MPKLCWTRRKLPNVIREGHWTQTHIRFTQLPNGNTLLTRGITRDDGSLFFDWTGIEISPDAIELLSKQTLPA